MSMPANILGPLERCLLLGPFHLGSLTQGALCPGGRASFGLSGSAFALLDAGARPYKAHNLRAHEGEASFPIVFSRGAGWSQALRATLPHAIRSGEWKGEVAARTSFQ